MERLSDLVQTSSVLVFGLILVFLLIVSSNGAFLRAHIHGPIAIIRETITEIGQGNRKNYGGAFRWICETASLPLLTIPQDRAPMLNKARGSNYPSWQLIWKNMGATLYFDFLSRCGKGYVE